MSNETSVRILNYFSDIEDPRIERNKRHKLIDILIIAICAVLCNADTWEDIEEFGHSKGEWFRKFLELPNGIPSHDTIRRLFIRLKPDQLQECFLSWVAALRQHISKEVISIDGKTARHSGDSLAGKAALHLVSAWANQNRLVLGQVAVDEKSNEITAVPQLLEILEVRGCIVTLDAMGCQKEITKEIQGRGADYVLALKGNQGLMHENVKLFLDDELSREFKDIVHDAAVSVEKDHGRFERREYYISSEIEWLEEKKDWAGLKSIGMVKATREYQGKTSVETRYYLTSLSADAKEFARAVRAHWGIENSMHWVMDIAFREDESRIRKDHSPQNFAVLRHIALNLVGREKTLKRSVRGKRLKAGWDNGYLERLLFGGG